jgi:hypothetical protein
MKNLTKNLVLASLFVTACLPLNACGKTTEKTTTIIKEAKPTEEKAGVKVRINGGGVGVEVNADNE